jgi:hypothetical protein
MSKSTSPISTEDLLNYLDTESSFGFEMRVRELFATRGLRYEHGGTYDDPHTGLPRQFDLQVDLNSRLGVIQIRVLLAIECKSLSEFAPMLVYRANRTVNESELHLVAHTCGDRKSITEVLSRHSPTHLFFNDGTTFPKLCTLSLEGSGTFYPPGEFVGKSIDVVSRDGNGKFRSGDTEVYGRWTQALQSATSLLQKLSFEDEREQKVRLTWIVPILVVPDRRLYVVDFEDDGTRGSAPVTVDRTAFFVDFKPPSFESSGIPFRFRHLEIMTYSGIKLFTEQITGAEAKEFLREQLNERICYKAFARF